MYFILYSNYKNIDLLCVKGHQNISQIQRILQRWDRALGSEFLDPPLCIVDI